MLPGCGGTVHQPYPTMTLDMGYQLANGILLDTHDSVPMVTVRVIPPLSPGGAGRTHWTVCTLQQGQVLHNVQSPMILSLQ